MRPKISVQIIVSYRAVLPFRVEGEVSNAIRVSVATGNRLTTHLPQLFNSLAHRYNLYL